MIHRLKNDSLDTTTSSNDAEVSQDNRIGATVRIWCITGAMLFAIFLASIGHTERAVWAILVGAAVGTAAVWGVFNSRSSGRLPQPETLKEMDARLANVETIVSYEEKVAEARSRRLETATE